MKAHKFDAALAGALQRQQPTASRFDVTVRVAAPLPAAQIAELAALGVPADARRSIFVADLDRSGLAALSDVDGVVSISLAQMLRPLGPRSKWRVPAPKDMTLNRDEQIFLHILFKGCTGKRLQLPLPLCAWQQRITPSPVIDQIVRLLNEHTWAQIADILNARGMTPTRKVRS